MTPHSWDTERGGIGEIRVQTRNLKQTREVPLVTWVCERCKTRITTARPTIRQAMEDCNLDLNCDDVVISSVMDS